ncbi:MAG: ABC transporter permease, partial [Vicinamibacterales bacterium]
MTPARRWFRRLLWLFPPSFRRARQAALERLFLDLQADRPPRGGLATLTFWLAIVTDAVTGAAAEWLAVARRAASTFVIRPGVPMSAIVASVRHAVRQLVRQPLYSGTIVLLVATGIAGNAAVFRIFDGLCLRTLPFDDPGRLVDVDETAPEWNLEFANVSITDFHDWREENSTFEGMTALTTSGDNVATADEARRVTTLTATHDVDDVLRLVPQLGRFFSEAEDQPNGPPVVMLSDAFWAEVYGRDPAVIGRTLRFGQTSREIVGVLPPEAARVVAADVWLPLAEDDESSFYLRVIGRLKPGVTVEQARADLDAIHARHIPERDVNRVTSPTVMLLRDRYLGTDRLGGVVLFGAVAIVLLIACGNIAGLMLARSMARSQELGLRAALGASRGRLVLHILAESLVLALVGGAGGLALSVWGSDALVGLLKDQLPAFIGFDLDWRFVAFVAAATIGTAVVAGIVPALRASRAAVGVAATSRTTASRVTRRAMAGLVTGEVALATLLLATSGFALVDLRAVGRIDPGFRTEGVLTFRVSPDEARYPTAADRQAFWARYRARLEAIPGVDAVSTATIMPLMGHSGWFFEAEGSTSESERNVVVLRRWVDPGYFETLGVPLRQGRTFDDFDGRTGDGVAIVNESFVRTHLGSTSSPLGHRIRLGEHMPWLTIVGVVADTKHYGIDQPSRPGVYEPSRQNPNRLGGHVAL